MSIDESLRDIFTEWEDGMLRGQEVEQKLFDLAIESGIDAVLAKTPEPWRESVFASLRDWALSESEEILRVFGGVYMYEYESDPIKIAQMRREVEERHAAEDAHFRAVTLPIIRAWWAARGAA